jgi:hypothetical protein
MGHQDREHGVYRDVYTGYMVAPRLSADAPPPTRPIRFGPIDTRREKLVALLGTAVPRLTDDEIAQLVEVLLPLMK